MSDIRRITAEVEQYRASFEDQRRKAEKEYAEFKSYPAVKEESRNLLSKILAGLKQIGVTENNAAVSFDGSLSFDVAGKESDVDAVVLLNESSLDPVQLEEQAEKLMLEMGIKPNLRFISDTYLPPDIDERLVACTMLTAGRYELGHFDAARIARLADMYRIEIGFDEVLWDRLTRFWNETIMKHLDRLEREDDLRVQREGAVKLTAETSVIS